MSSGTPPIRKRDLITLLNQNTLYWETARKCHGKWYATARTKTQGRPVRASATNERQALLNLCCRLDLL